MLVCLCQLFSLTWPFTSDTLPEGLVRELPSADKSQELPTSEAPLTSNDDLEDLRRQLEALNSWYPQQFPTHHANFFTKLKIFIDSIFVTWFVIFFCLSFGGVCLGLLPLLLGIHLYKFRCYTSSNEAPDPLNWETG